MKKKTNPRRIPVSQADAEKAKVDGMANGILLVIWTLANRQMLNTDQLRYLESEVEYTAQSIAEGRITFDNFREAMKEEYGVEVVIE